MTTRQVVAAVWAAFLAFGIASIVWEDRRRSRAAPGIASGGIPFEPATLASLDRLEAKKKPWYLEMWALVIGWLGLTLIGWSAILAFFGVALVLIRVVWGYWPAWVLREVHKQMPYGAVKAVVALLTYAVAYACLVGVTYAAGNALWKATRRRHPSVGETKQGSDSE
jgi:hypothetical protein